MSQTPRIHRVRRGHLPSGVPADVTVEEFSSSDSDAESLEDSAPEAATGSGASSTLGTPLAAQLFGIPSSGRPAGENSLDSEHILWSSTSDSASADGQGAHEDAYIEPLYSLGSLQHATGDCRPCVFMIKGCARGGDCAFCHLHPDFKRYHPSKERRQRMRRRADRAAAAEAASSSSAPAHADRAAAAEAASSSSAAVHAPAAGHYVAPGATEAVSSSSAAVHVPAADDGAAGRAGAVPKPAPLASRSPHGGRAGRGRGAGTARGSGGTGHYGASSGYGKGGKG